MKKSGLKKLWKILKTLGIIGIIAYVILFIVFFFDLDGKLLYYVVEPFLCKHYDSIERKNPMEAPYGEVPEGKVSL